MNMKSHIIGNWVKRVVLAGFMLGSLVGLSSITIAQTGEPSREPILRIETGMHTAQIRRIGVDAANRFLVTASEDKTLRVWELPSGRLLRTIRVPIGEGDEGKLRAVAISPDGSTIAVGGWTGYEWEKTYCIYLFDRKSGRLIRRLGGLPNVVSHLVYAPDGRYLAATLSGKNGVRVFSTAAYAPAGEDRDYGDRSDGADFDRAGKLVTVSWDGLIRLYATGSDGSLRLLAKQSTAGGQQPYDVKFSPDGSRVAVGFGDSTKVAVLQASDLAPLYAPDTTGVDNGNLSSVAWSAEGKTLYAGGRAYASGGNIYFIRAWAAGGRGGYRDIARVAASGIMHILPLRDGGIIYGAFDPAFGVD
jgi:WD40 repeat protein